MFSITGRTTTRDDGRMEETFEADQGRQAALWRHLGVNTITVQRDGAPSRFAVPEGGAQFSGAPREPSLRYVQIGKVVHGERAEVWPSLCPDVANLSDARYGVNALASASPPLTSSPDPAYRRPFQRCLAPLRLRCCFLLLSETHLRGRNVPLECYEYFEQDGARNGRLTFVCVLTRTCALRQSS